MNTNEPGLSPDDPKITAYALNELSPAARGEVSRGIARSSELRTEVEEICATAEMLKGELAREAKEAERFIKADELFAANLGAPRVVPFPPRHIAFGTALAAIAATIIVVLAWRFWPNRPHPRTNAAGIAQATERKEQTNASNNPGATQARLTNGIAQGEQNWRTAFYDAGAGYYRPYEFNSERERGVDLGFRLNVPCPGPLQCDYAIPVRDLTGSDQGRFNFTVSYQREL
jgi:hypothetical protein